MDATEQMGTTKLLTTEMRSKYDINRPWLSLDPWQKEYCFNKDFKIDNFLLTGRQVGKTTAMSIRAVELCLKHYKQGEFVLINSITEKQAYHMLAKAQVYANQLYSKQIITRGKDKPTKHKLMFKNGTGILCYAAGETGEGLRGFTIKKIMSDEGSRMSEEYFIATLPALSVVGGTLDIASTPFGKLHKDGSEKFFYKCSKDKKFKKYFVSGEDCPRHTKDHLETAKERLSKLAYAQEYLAVFTDELQRLISDELINEMCILEPEVISKIDKSFFLGVDIAALGEDETSYEILEKLNNGNVVQRKSETDRKKLTTETSQKIINMHFIWDFRKIGIDDGGVGFGVFSELMNESSTKRKTVPLNNASRPIDNQGKKTKRILKEEMYMNLIVYAEKKKLLLLNDAEIKDSLRSIQHDEGKIFGSNSHITEGIIRALWLIENSKNLNNWIDSIKI